jgi:hypothetical protein
MTDQEVLISTLREARRIIGEYPSRLKNQATTSQASMATIPMALRA